MDRRYKGGERFEGEVAGRGVAPPTWETEKVPIHACMSLAASLSSVRSVDWALVEQRRLKESDLDGASLASSVKER